MTTEKIANDFLPKRSNTNFTYTTGDDDSHIETSVQSDRAKEMMQNSYEQKTTAKQTPPKNSTKIRRLANPDVKRWYDNLARGSQLTADTRLAKLSRFCELHSMTPMELTELGQRDLKSLMDLIHDHITWMEDEDKAPQYIKSTLTAVKSWLRHFDIELTRRFKINNVDSTPTLENERVPIASEMSEIMNRADLRAGLAISLIAKSGLRPQVLGNHDGTDGLTIGDIPDVVIQEGVAKCFRCPVRINVRKSLSKTRRPYFTFLPTQGIKKLIADLNVRLARGEAINVKSPVIALDTEHPHGRGNNAGKRFLETSRIYCLIKSVLEPRFDWRPYVFRAYFDTQLLIAENRGKIAHDFRVFFMGHKGSIEAKYTTNKGLLPDELIEEMREAFKRSEEFLDLEVREEDPLLKQKEQLHTAIQNAAPEKVQEVLRILGICNT